MKDTDTFDETTLIVGRNAVAEAIKAGRSINKILVAEGYHGAAQNIVAAANDRKIIVENVPRDRLDKISNGQKHQGVIAFAAPINYATIDDIISRATDQNQPPFILLLDELQDPQNFGAILRTADAVGVHGVIIPKRRSVTLNATVAKISAGAIEYVPVVQIGNVAQIIRQLKKLGLTIVGSDLDGQSIYNSIDLTSGIVLIIGNEGKGIRRLTKELCDLLIKIPMNGKINSLNASAAAAVLMYEVYRQRSLG